MPFTTICCSSVIATDRSARAEERTLVVAEVTLLARFGSVARVAVALFTTLLADAACRRKLTLCDDPGAIGPTPHVTEPVAPCARSLQKTYGELALVVL